MKDCILRHILKPILPLLQEQVEQIDNNSIYTLSLSPFTINLLFCIIQGIKSISLLISLINSSPMAKELSLIVASKAMYSDAFHRYPAQLFRAMFISLSKTLNYIPIPELQSLGQFYLIDGSIFPAIKTMTWAKYKDNFNAVKLHMCFNLNLMLPVTFITTEANYCEKKALLQMIEEGITFIADRGYFKFKLFIEIVTSKAHFIIRGKTKMIFTVVDILPLDMPGQMLELMSRATDMIVTFDNDKSKNKYRIVSFKVMGEIYNLITDRFDLTTFQVIMLYAYRWQVELIFRFLKRTLHGLHLWSHNPNGIETQFTIYMIAYLLLLHMKQQSNLEKKNADNGVDLSAPWQDNESKPTRANGHDLVTILGKRLQSYWRIGIHWLTKIRNLLFELPTSQNLRLLC